MLGAVLQQFDAINTAVFAIGVLAVYTAFHVVYLNLGKEFIKPDFNLSAFEKEFWTKFLHYVPWAAFQQCLLLVPLRFIECDDLIKFALAMMIFAIVHIPNFRLMLFTAIFGAWFYGFWYFGDFDSYVYIILLHAFGGTAYYKTGWDMRVWRFEK